MLDIALEQEGAIPVLRVRGIMEAPDVSVLSAYFGTGRSILVVDLSETRKLLPEGGEILLRAARKAKRQEGQIILVASSDEAHVDRVLNIQGASREFMLYEKREQALRSAEALHRQRLTKSLGGQKSVARPVEVAEEKPPVKAEKQCPNCKAKNALTADRCYLCGMLLSDRQTMLFHQPEFEPCPNCNANMLVDSEKCPLCGFAREKPVEAVPPDVAPASPMEQPPMPALIPSAELSEMAANLNELEDRRTALRREISDLEMKQYEIDGRISQEENAGRLRIGELEERFNELTGFVEELEIKRAEMIESVAALDAKAQESRQSDERAVFSEAQADRAEADALKEEIAELVLRRDEVQIEIARISEHAEAARRNAAEGTAADRARIAAEMEEVALEFEKLGAARDQLMRDIDQMRAAAEDERGQLAEQIETEKENARTELKAIQIEVADVRKEIARLADLRSEEDRALEAVNVQKQAALDEAATLEETSKATLAAVETARLELATLRDQLGESTKERDEAIARLEDRAQELRQEVAALADERSAQERELERIRGDVERQSNVAAQSLDEEIEERQSRIAALAADEAKMDEELAERRSAIEKLAADRSSQELAMQSFAEDEARLSREIDSRRAQLNELMEQEAQVASRLEEDRRAAEAVLSEHDRLADLVNDRRAQLDDLAAEQENIACAIADRRAELEGLDGAVASKRDDSESVQLSEHRLELEGLMTDIKDRRAELLALGAERSQAVEELRARCAEFDALSAKQDELARLMDERRTELNQLESAISEARENIQAGGSGEQESIGGVEASWVKSLTVAIEQGAQVLDLMRQKSDGALRGETFETSIDAHRDLEERLEAKERLRCEAEEKYEAAAGELELLKMRMSEIENRGGQGLRDLNEERKHLEAINDRLRREREEIERSKEFELKSMEILKREVGRWMREHVKASSQGDGEIIAAMRAEIERLREGKSDDSGKPDDTANLEVMALRSEVEKVRREYLELSRRSEGETDLHGQVDALTAKIEKLDADHAADLAELNSERKNHAIEKERLLAAQADMESEIANLRDAGIEMRNLRDRAKQAEEELEDARRELAAASDAEVRAIQTAQDIETEVGETVRRLEKERDEAIVSAERLGQSRQAEAELVETVRRLEKERDEAIASAARLGQSRQAEAELVETVRRLEKERDEAIASARRLEEERIGAIGAERVERDELHRELTSASDEIERMRKEYERSLPVRQELSEPEEEVERIRTIAPSIEAVPAAHVARSFDIPMEDDTENIELLMSRAYAMEDEGSSHKAVETYHKILRIDPSHLKALHNLALLKYRSGDIAGASEHLHRIESVTKDVPAETKRLFAEVKRHKPEGAPSWRRIFGS